ncbi:MAG: signal peptidase I [Bacteroidales bacterium]|nr:signal peptidase I [Bacteroidales bacterium]
MAKKKYINSLLDWIKAIFIAFLLLLLIRIIFIQSYTVVSSSMEKTLLPGDNIVINKTKYGYRFPITLLTMPFNNNKYLDWIELPYLRFPSSDKIKNNDLIAFNYPNISDIHIDKKDVYIKRCIGLPNDTIVCYGKKITINNNLIIENENVQYNYRVTTNGSKLNKKFFDKYDITEGQLVADIGVYDLPLRKEQAMLLLNDSKIRYVRLLKQLKGENSFLIFPHSRYYNWNSDNFGSIIVPKKGSVIKINFKTLPLYKRIIETYEGNDLKIEKYRILINNRVQKTYTFKNNYYYVIDDNRDKAKDSRYWGFVPEDHIIGKASFVWLSIDKNNKWYKKIRWSRFLKSVN